MVAVSTVLAESAIDNVVILGGLTAVPEMLIDTGDFVRPIWRDGVLTLVTQFGRGGVLHAPSSPVTDPAATTTEHCADHETTTECHAERGARRDHGCRARHRSLSAATSSPGRPWKAAVPVGRFIQPYTARRSISKRVIDRIP